MRIERDQLCTILIVLGLVAIYAVGVWIPHRKRTENVRRQIKEATQQLEVDRANSRKLDSLARKVFDLKQVVSSAPQIVPREGELAGLLKRLSADLEYQGAADQAIEVRPTIETREYSVIPVTLRFRASFAGVFSFLKKIEAMDRLVRIEQLSLEGDPERPTKPLAVDIELGAFFTSDQVESP